MNSPPLTTRASVETHENRVDAEANEVARLLADLQTARTHLNKAIDALPSLTIGDQSRRCIEAHIAVMRVRLMQLLDEL